MTTKQKQIWLPWIRKQKNDQIVHIGCGNKEYEYKYDNNTETNLVSIDKETEKFSDMTYPAMMEE